MRHCPIIRHGRQRNVIPCVFEKKDPMCYKNHEVFKERYVQDLFTTTQNMQTHPPTNDPQSFKKQFKLLNRRTTVMSCLVLASSIFSSGPTWMSNSNANASYIDSKTGINLPSPGDIEQSIPPKWDDSFIQSMDKSSFTRLDNKPDSTFYAEPRLVEHVDEAAVKTMTRFISSFVSSTDSVLDLCSSWTSHIEPNISKNLKRVAGLGMNAKELEMNPILTEWTVMDLNAIQNPILPYENESFDTVLCQLSIDYLIHPLEVMREVGRVLKVGGRVAILFSNRLFIQKVNELLLSNLSYIFVFLVI